MNLYGCLPASYMPSHSTLSYWAQAATLVGLPGSESALTSASLALSLKKAQLPISINDVLQKSRGAASLRSLDDISSSFRRATAHSIDAVAALSHHSRLQLHAHLQQQHHHHRQQQHHQHRPFSSTPPPMGNGLAPLQALCDSDVSVFTAKSTSATAGATSTIGDSKTGLKFGMSRILSDDFGKTKTEKENTFKLSSIPDSCRSLPLCPCNSPSCTAYARPPSPYPRGSLPSLSAVHALQPPHYPLSSSVDALPGPYSILSTDNSSANQPKRKRSWSRAVFSNLQRKGLEKRFEVQKYVTKPDRRQLAAMLGLTDAQVKVWFQNRRMKWRHAQQQGEKDKQAQQADDQSTPHESKADRSDKGGGPDKSGIIARGDDSTGRHRPSRTSSPEAADVASAEQRATNQSSLPARKLATSHHPDVSPRFYTPVCTPDTHCLNLAAQFDTKNDHPLEVAGGHGLTTEHYEDRKASQLRRSMRSPSSGMDETFCDATMTNGKMDSDEGSRSGLEIDSDVDVNEDIEEDNADEGRDLKEETGPFDDDISMKEIDVDN